MKSRALISFAGLLFFVSFVVINGPGCANIVPPQGGFKDSLPPELVRVNPADSTKNFSGNKISFSFDEYVQLDNFSQNVLVSPVPKVTPTANFRLNTVTVHLRDTLEPNTTYTINFGESIKDVNEGNIMKGFTYVFSTGPTIDSLTFAGNVIMAESGGIDTTLTVMLHKSPDDSAVVKERPRYVTKLDGKGRFVFHNLPPGTFYVYALQDDSRSYRYLDNKKLFAFADSPVIIQQHTAPKTLFAYQAVRATDAGAAAAPGRANAADRRLKFQTTVKNNTQDLLQKFHFQFERPLRTYDTTRIRLSTDSTYTPVTGYSWSLDSTRKVLTLNYDFAEDTRYNLIMQKDFATDTLGQQLLKADTIRFTTMQRSEYGMVSIRFRNLDLSKNPVLQFVQSGAVISSYPLTSATFTQPLFLPGEYELRILNDANRNGVWDPGIFYGRHKQPEIVKPVGRKSITIRQNWENEFEISL